MHAQAHLNAFIKYMIDEALTRANELDTQQKFERYTIGKLHGVVIGLKDVICYKDHELSASSNILKGLFQFILLLRWNDLLGRSHYYWKFKLR